MPTEAEAKRAAYEKERRAKLIAIVTARGLTSYMNDTKWRELCAAVHEELPFPPAFEQKYLEAEAIYSRMDGSGQQRGGGGWDMSHFGFWVEWTKVMPRRFLARGKLVPPKVEDCKEAFTSILNRLRVPYVDDGDFIIIYGHGSKIDFSSGA
jgi:hypothetical protein